MVKYESIFITEASATDDEVAGLVKGFEETITAARGKMLKVERWGKRRLAYRIGRHEDGNYTLLQMECPPPAAHELERRYRMNDRIIKYLTVRLDRDIPETAPVPAEPTAVDVPSEPGEAD